MAKLSRRSTVFLLVALCGVIICSRLYTYREPLERDLTTYAVIAHEMLGGKALYRELWDHKPPAIHVTYAAAELIAGYGRGAIFLMNITAAIGTLIACYWAGSSAGGGRIGGGFAAALWALTSGNLALEGNQPNTEVFINLFLTSAFAVLVRKEKGSLGARGALIVGVFFGVASLYKQVVIIQAGLLAAAYFVCCESDNRKRALTDIAIIAFTGAVIWAAVFAYFFLRGSGSAFIEAVFTYNRYYSANGWHNRGISNAPAALLPEILGLLGALLLLTAGGAIYGLVRGPRRHWVLLIALAVATQIAVLSPGWFFGHYYQLWLPVLAIGTGWSIALLRRVLPLRLSPLAYAVGAFACAMTIMMQIADYMLPPKGWSLKKYGRIFLSSDQLAHRITTLLKPDATFYEWGNETGLYYVSGRRPASPITFAYPMLRGPLAVKLSNRLLGDLNRERPEIVIISKQTLTETAPKHPVVEWIKANYSFAFETHEFILLARNGVALDLTPRNATAAHSL